MRAFFLSFTILLLSFSAIAQPLVEWDRSYYDFWGGTCKSIIQTRDGGYFFGTEDGVIIKTDSDGEVQWNDNSTGNYNYLSALQSPDGNYVSAGYSTPFISGESRFSIRKKDSIGESIWVKSYGGSLADEAYSTILTRDGGYIMAGRTYSSDGDVTEYYGQGDMWIVKLDADGNLEWQKTIGDSGANNAKRIIQTADGNYVILGTYNLGYWVGKIDQLGNLLWEKKFQESNFPSFETITETSDNGLLLIGTVLSTNLKIIKLDEVGEELWVKILPFDHSQNVNEIKAADDGGFVFVGTYNADGTGTGRDYWLAKLDIDGDIEWDTKLNGIDIDTDYGYTFDFTADGGYVVSGSSQSNNAGVWVVKLFHPKGKVSGTVFKDQNNDCAPASPESLGFPTLISANGNRTFRTFSALDGAYELPLDTGDYDITLELTDKHQAFQENITCPVPNYHSIRIDSNLVDTIGLDFALDLAECPLLEVSISSTRRRRCFNNQTTIQYCNNGTIPSTAAEIHLQLPAYVQLINADHSFTLNADGSYTFVAEPLQVLECKTIKITDYVECLPGITGLTQCTKAWITPANICYNNLDSTGQFLWDQSHINVQGECLNNALMLFTLVNSGTGDMVDSSEYRLFLNGQLSEKKQFKLNSEDSLYITLPANGYTVHFEADQHPNHPNNSTPSVFIQNCDTPPVASGTILMPNDDDYATDIDCTEIIDSFDPNDKQVLPAGVGATHIVEPGKNLTYTIRFQNTGTDTAYTVVLKDLISEWIDPSSLNFIGASHPYTIDISGSDRLLAEIRFDNINLPDSTTNVSKSQGFIKYQAQPLANIPLGTRMDNTADIYFDFNAPIRTNNAFVTIDVLPPFAGSPLNSEESETPPLISPVTSPQQQKALISIFPNPTTSEISIVSNSLFKEAEVTDINGRILMQSNAATFLLPPAAGVYFIKVKTDLGTSHFRLVKL